MKKLNLILDETNWIEAVWYEDNKQIYCESFSGHSEHIALLRAKAKEFNTSLKEYEPLIKQCQDSFIYPTDEELLVEANKAKVQEARAYLVSTAWYVERLNDPSSGKAIPQEVLDKRAEARVLINELEG